MKKIIITGASKGIGKEVALSVLRKNLIVIGVSRNHTIKHKNYFPIIFDLSKSKGIKKCINDIIIKHKKIDAIINNAGFGIFDNIENISEESIESYFNLNLISHILISKFLISHFKKKNTGYFIFIGSEAAIEGKQKATLYSSAKHGLMGFVKSLREECNKSDIRVTIVNPGMVRSTFFDNLNFKPGENKKNAIKKSDLADLICFLLESNRYINYNHINLTPIKKVIDFKK